MIRILFALIATLICNISFACEKYQLPAGYQDYLDAQDLSYRQPVGNFTQDRKASCSLTQDFNNDGKPDFAGLFMYTGPKKRGGNRFLDLVIMYSVNDSIEHTIYSYAGRFDKKNKVVQAYLEELSPGVIDTDPGEFILNTPGIKLVNIGRDNYTYYWNGRRIVELIIGD